MTRFRLLIACLGCAGALGSAWAAARIGARGSFTYTPPPPIERGPAALGPAYREDHDGWVYVHLQGAPHEIGYQHGYLLAPEIDDALRMFGFFVKRSYGKDWAYFRRTAQTLFWPKLDPEYRQEIQGIADGLRARGKPYDATDVTALNGWMEIAWYQIPAFDEQAKKAGKAAGEHCSAFIANGAYTKDHQIVMAHNSWVDYIVGERWNVIADIVPKHGLHILMDSFPGFIHSGDDFVENSAGLMYTETTIGAFKGFDPHGVPEFQRARKAAQYGRSIDDFIRIMTAGNNGGYANDWLVGDVKTNEIARLELALKRTPTWRTHDGILYGANYPCDDRVTAQETSYDAADSDGSSPARKLRWERLGEEEKGQIDAETAKRMIADHYDEAHLRRAANCRTLCGHYDSDPKGSPDGGWGPYYPAGAVQGKVTTAALAKRLQLWARMGHPCGADFLAGPYFRQHRAYAWQAAYLRDMKGHPWALVAAAR